MNINREEFEEACGVFIESVSTYFDHSTKQPADTGVPYLKDQANVPLLEYTGAIAISGSNKGFIYISGERTLFKELISKVVGFDDPTDEDILDMAGEVSNVVAGNLRETYGEHFMISVPTVFEGKPKRLKFQDKVNPYVIPINWKRTRACIVVGLE
ncbi:MAG: chemotaxis protein CheX [Cyclobacteriaceae bacterium]